MKFKDINLNRKLIDKTIENKFDELTKIQEKCIPEILEGKDVVGQAETGSGKTIAFCLPILEMIKPGDGVQTLVITPTRELCVQVTDVFKEFGKTMNIKTVSIYGGVGIEPQIKRLGISEIVVGTPGRLLDHIGRRTLDLRRIRFLILDETDKMFDMGFIDDIERIISHVPRKRQTLMFSATISSEIHGIIKRHLHNPSVIKTKSYVDQSKLEQIYYDIYQQDSKFSILLHLLKENSSGLSIVFCATRIESDVVAKNLKRQGINASAIHGGMTQNKRLQSLDALRNETVDVLVATDVAARGLDIKNVTHIYHYDVPNTPKEYIHRIGRTARAGEKGSAITLLTERDHDNFRRVQSNKELVIERAKMPEFEKVPFVRNVKNKNYGKNKGNKRFYYGKKNRKNKK